MPLYKNISFIGHKIVNFSTKTPYNIHSSELSITIKGVMRFTPDQSVTFLFSKKENLSQYLCLSSIFLIIVCQ